MKRSSIAPFTEGGPHGNGIVYWGEPPVQPKPERRVALDPIRHNPDALAHIQEQARTVEQHFRKAIGMVPGRYRVLQGVDVPRLVGKAWLGCVASLAWQRIYNSSVDIAPLSDAEGWEILVRRTA